MKKVLKFSVLALVVIAAATLSSCNRGYGCPTDLKAAAQTATLFFGK